MRVSPGSAPLGAEPVEHGRRKSFFGAHGFPRLRSSGVTAGNRIILMKRGELTDRLRARKLKPHKLMRSGFSPQAKRRTVGKPFAVFVGGYEVSINNSIGGGRRLIDAEAA